ncbi:MAG: hypothetical protein OJF51_002439 [Nitrospira sp.]|jgi:hypothetical protein|nr:MAG: hypothetical protein OJF51_002439 [Nitrospira sp.]
MSLLEDITKGPASTVLVGLGIAMVAPTVIPAVASGLRPLAKALVRGGLVLYDAAKEGVAEAGEQFNDLVEETRAEMNQEGKHETHGGNGEHGAAAGRSHRRRARTSE